MKYKKKTLDDIQESVELNIIYCIIEILKASNSFEKERLYGFLDGFLLSINDKSN